MKVVNIVVISLNQLIQYKYNHNHIERVIWIDEKYQVCYLVNIFDDTLPNKRLISDIEEMITNKHIEFIQTDPWANLHIDSHISKKSLALQEQAWKVINKLLSNGVENLLISEKRNELIHELSTEIELSKKTILKYLKRYWKRGMTKTALLPDFQNCGGRGKDKSDSTVKRGRPRKFVGTQGVNIDEETKNVFRIAKRRFYEKKNNVTLRFAYEQMIKEFYKKELKECPELLPTYKQFVYWLRKEQDDRKTIILKNGKRHFDLNYRPLLSSATSEVQFPLEKVQIDSTVADVFLVSEFNRNWIIGRPILYFCKDVWSRMIVGIHVSLDGPNFEQARIALMNMVENKKQFCKRYGIEIDETDWPTAHLPACLVADRAELLSNASNILTEELNIKIENSAPYRGDFKSIVEQHFRLLNIQVKPLLPGAVHSDFQKRGAKDYRLAGKLTLKEFTQIVIKCVLYYNNHHVIDQYVRDKDLIQSGIEAVPIKLWNWGIQNKAGKLRTISKDLMMLHLLPRATATVTGKGIKFKNIYYGSTLALKEQWFVKARLNGSWKVDITYDPREMDFIYIRGIHKNSFERCFLLDHQHRYGSTSICDVDYLHQYEKMKKTEHKQEELTGKIQLLEDIEEIIKKAEKQVKKEVVEISKSSRLKGIKRNRQFEKEMLLQERDLKDRTNGNKENSLDPDLLLIKKIQKKGLKGTDE